MKQLFVRFELQGKAEDHNVEDIVRICNKSLYPDDLGFAGEDITNNMNADVDKARREAVTIAMDAYAVMVIKLEKQFGKPIGEIINVG